MSKTLVYRKISPNSNKPKKNAILRNQENNDIEDGSFLKSNVKQKAAKKPNPLLKAGEKLPKGYSDILPSKLIGSQLEDIDEFYENENVKFKAII